MAGIRTSPDSTLTPTYKSLSVHWVDESNDIWSESYPLPVDATNVEIEAFLDSLQAGSGASIYWHEVNTHFGSRNARNAGNADSTDAKSGSVFDSVNLTMKHTTDPFKKDILIRVPAPMNLLFVENAEGDTFSDQVLGTSVELLAIQTAAEAAFTAYQVLWARYSEKTELNFPVTSLSTTA